MDDTTHSLIDIFRFVITKQEASGSADPSTDKNQLTRVQCLDLSSLLLDKKIIDETDGKPWDKLQQILFERLVLDDYNSQRLVSIDIKTKSSVNIDAPFSANDSQILRYLYGCFFRLQFQNNINQEFKKSLTDTILNQVTLYLMEPDVFPDRDKRYKNNQQAPLLLNLVNHYYTGPDPHGDVIQKFINSLGDLNSDNDAGLEAIVGPTYNRFLQKFVSMAIEEPTLQEWLLLVRVFLQHPNIAQKFLEKNVLKRDNTISYQSTLLGFMLTVSHLPRPTNLETTFFKNIGNDGHKFAENQLGIKLRMVAQELQKTFKILLKQPQTRNLFLSWIGRCLHTFRDRKKLWSNQILMSTTPISVNDGFLLNFLNVMLLLSEPFAGPYNFDFINQSSHTIDKKMLKIDPRYCKWSKMDHESSPVHILGLADETFLIKANEDDHETGGEVVQPNFISECFFGTHQAFTYGFRSVYERFFKLYQTITDLQQTYLSAQNQVRPPASISGPDPLEMIKKQADAAMTQFYNLKAALMVPSLITMQLHFCIATAAYLNHLVACESFEEAINAKEFKTITPDMLRTDKLNRVCLRYMPEMLIENILDFFIFLKNFNGSALAQATNMLEPLMTLIITFMGKSSLMQNPHLRARFAEILECLMPHSSSDPYRGTGFLGCPELFETHPLVEQIAPALVNVFVSIEMTGEGVQFEQKFSYRRPMYLVLEYLWERPFHRQMLTQLAEEAEKNIDSARPPLFLRFVNLLMNDAIFLLDEALGYMNQLRESEHRKKSPEWQSLNPQQRAQAESQYAHIGRLARFHNVLSMSTIGTLSWLTTEIKTIFCHPTLVDRIANMLNYFLEHLVGPKKKKFNVSDKNEYEFRPKEILEKICQIYINLGMSDTNNKCREFCSAVSSDGRSYSENLLPQATDILFRTGKCSLGTEFEKLSQLVRDVAQQNQLDEIATEDIPDTFLDPIMSTLMSDPVLLPSSKIIVDRSTIARHLLSDQTDPFNRSPLSMEDVIPEVDLKKQIDTFLMERRRARREK
uniref:Ubiquitin conjugation factor E4 A n=1 Tax=Aceria tosichella TaxID=561515 RepID=A0A6G1S3T2_9ACAR